MNLYNTPMLVCNILFYKFFLQLEPYLMPMYVKENGTYIKVYQGFIVDLVYKLSRMLKFQYDLIPEPEGKYGHRNSHGLWDGMIGLLQRKVRGKIMFYSKVFGSQEPAKGNL